MWGTERKECLLWLHTSSRPGPLSAQTAELMPEVEPPLPAEEMKQKTQQISCL